MTYQIDGQNSLETGVIHFKRIEGQSNQGHDFFLIDGSAASTAIHDPKTGNLYQYDNADDLKNPNSFDQNAGVVAVIDPSGKRYEGPASPEVVALCHRMQELGVLKDKSGLGVILNPSAGRNFVEGADKKAFMQSMHEATLLNAQNKAIELAALSGISLDDAQIPMGNKIGAEGNAKALQEREAMRRFNDDVPGSL